MPTGRPCLDQTLTNIDRDKSHLGISINSTKKSHSNAAKPLHLNTDSYSYASAARQWHVIRPLTIKAVSSIPR
ncbi:hypothetical protein D3C78_92620 [compost metagenome]